MKRSLQNLLLVALAAVMMAFGWLELTGLVMLGGFVPLLILAARYDASRRSWWKMTGWTMLFIALWYAITTWWIWLATPAGNIASTFFACVYTGLPFMLWFFISKRAPKALSYTVLVSAWMVGEWIYNTSQASFPWLAVGNGFAHDIWAVQWYEWTGSFGGTLWVLITSILIYEFLIVRRPRLERRRRTLATQNWLPPALAVVMPIVVSLAIYFTYDEPTRTAKISIVQPNISAWEEDSIPPEEKAANLAELAARTPTDARFIVMPETTIGETVFEGRMAESPSLATLRATAAEHSPGATVVVGAMTRRDYGNVPKPTQTAYGSAETGWYDYYNAAIAISPTGEVAIHHKAKMVIGAEMMPTWWWVRGLVSLVENLGFYAGHYGYGTVRTVFENDGMPGSGAESIFAGAGICWESVYGEYTSEFVRNGAEVLFIITNDGWWGDTPGHRQHFDLARLRAVETRRAIARSANTGRSGFITSRGDVGAADLSAVVSVAGTPAVGSSDGPAIKRTLDWEERGVLTGEVTLNRRKTLFVRFGDWPCRVSLLVLGLAVLYFVAYRIRKKNNIVE